MLELESGVQLVYTTDNFHVKVDLHQGSELSPILFNIVFDVITEKVRVEPPDCILNADGIVLVGESRRQMEMKLERWMSGLKSRGMRINRTKTKYFTTDVSGGRPICHI